MLEHCPGCDGDHLPNEDISQDTIPPERRSKILALAKQHVREGDLELDNNAVISEGEDNGAYVQMWKWVEFGGTMLCKGDAGAHTECADGCPTFDKLMREEDRKLGDK